MTDFYCVDCYLVANAPPATGPVRFLLNGTSLCFAHTRERLRMAGVVVNEGYPNMPN
jgi:hypothetical protein